MARNHMALKMIKDVQIGAFDFQIGLSIIFLKFQDKRANTEPGAQEVEDMLGRIADGVFY